MNRSLSETIVKQLRVSHNSSLERGIWSSFKQADWERTFSWLDLSGLTLYLRNRLEATNCFSMLPGAVRDRLDKCQTDNRLRVDAMTDELKNLNDMFNGSSIEHLVLKGVSLFPDYCPDPGLRTQYDHDLLIRSDCVSRTAALFQASGYRRKSPEGEHPIVYRRPEGNVGFSTDFEAFYSPQLGRSIEVHYRLWESAEERIEIDLSRDLFEHASRRHWDGVEYMCLGDEDALIFQVLHAFRHILRNWCRLSAFLEIAYFLDRRSSDSSFWERFADRLNHLRWVPEATIVVFTLAELLFRAPIPEQLKKQLRPARFPALALWTERYGRSSALANFRNDKYSLFLHREFVEDPAAWAGIRRRRLFPVQRPHRLPEAVFQRGCSRVRKLWMECCHALSRAKFHLVSVIRYAWEYPQWMLLRHSSE